MAGEITQLKAWAGPGPYFTIADKTEPVIPIDRGSDRYTALRASVAPGRYFPVLDKTATSAPGTARDDTAITQLRAGALAGAIQVIADKTPSLTDEIVSSDTYFVWMSLSWTDAIAVEITDTYRPVLTLAGSPQTVISASDTFRPRLTLTGTVSKGGSTPVARSDVYVPVLTLATASLLAAEFYTGADTYVPVLALATGTLSTEDVKTASDTYVPVLQFGFTLTPNTFDLVPAADSYTVRLTLAGTPQAAASDVDRIVGSLRPYGVITGRWI